MRSIVESPLTPSSIVVSRYVQCQPGGQASVRANRASLVRLSMVMCLRLRVHDPSRRSPSADNAPEEHRSAIARHAVVVPGHVAVNPAPHRSPLFDRSDDGRREARKMPSARAVDLRENVGRIARTHFRLESQLLDRNTVLARSLTLVKSAFTSESGSPLPLRGCGGTGGWRLAAGKAGD